MYIILNSVVFSAYVYTIVSLITTVAIRRLYESVRQQFLSLQPDNIEKAQTVHLKKKYRSRRERVRSKRV